MPGQDQIKQADQCLNMADLRAGIDHLDRLLVKLLSERQRYIERAAEIKAHAAEIRDETRIADVLAKVTAEAARAGLDRTIAQAVWTTLMEQCIALEMREFERLQRAK
jgi:isochorismate pyruvate lyase